MKKDIFSRIYRKIFWTEKKENRKCHEMDVHFNYKQRHSRKSKISDFDLPWFVGDSFLSLNFRNSRDSLRVNRVLKKNQEFRTRKYSVQNNSYYNSRHEYPTIPSSDSIESVEGAANLCKPSQVR